MIGTHKSYTPHRDDFSEIKARLTELLHIVRFMEKVASPNKNGCWEWQGSIVHKTRGPQRIDTSFRWNGRSQPAHRAAYEIFIGPLPLNSVVCHTCDNRLCVNPKHLFIGTQGDNMKDKMLKGRAKRRLSENDIIKIRSDSRAQRTIAAEYNVTQGNISAIKTGRIWGWLK